MQIANRNVKLGDRLFHVPTNVWGTVVSLESTAVVLELESAGQVIKIYVNEGGLVHGRKVVYWHQPLVLDLPIANVGKFQAILDTVVKEFA